MVFLVFAKWTLECSKGGESSEGFVQVDALLILEASNWKYSRVNWMYWICIKFLTDFQNGCQERADFMNNKRFRCNTEDGQPFRGSMKADLQSGESDTKGFAQIINYTFIRYIQWMVVTKFNSICITFSSVRRFNFHQLWF